MTTASTHSGKKTHRYYRCQTRDKLGKTKCRAKQLPAHAIEEFVVERITAATADGKLAESIREMLMARIDAERAELATLEKALPDQVAEASSAAKKLVESIATLDGHARELVEDKLRVEADRLHGAQRQLDALPDDMADLERAAREVEWIAGALSYFDGREQAMAIAVKKPKRYATPKNLEDVSGSPTPPQSFQYLAEAKV